MNKAIAELEDVTAGYNGEAVLRNINLKVYPKDFIGVIGPNGGGKTTMVKVLLGIIQPFKGQVSFPSGKINIGYLPQASRVDRSFPISVEEVIQSGFKTGSAWWPRLSKVQKARSTKLIDETGLSAYRKRPVGELSGGQLQRVLLSRALINQPELLILDEPNTYVDKNFEGELYKWLQELNKNMAIILVSHDLGTISSMVKTIACVNQNMHYHPSNEVTAGMLESYNAPLKIVAHDKAPRSILNKYI